MAWALLLLFASLLHAETESRSLMEISIAKQRASITVQRQSFAKQPLATVAPPDAFFVQEANLPTPVFVAEGCERLSQLEIGPLIDSAARKEDLSADLLQAVIRQESAFQPCAVSSKGALGLMQLMPGTADDLGVHNPFDPIENVNGGARLLRQLMDRYGGDLNRVLGAYNAGPARVDAADGVPRIPETLNYVQTILGNLGH